MAIESNPSVNNSDKSTLYSQVEYVVKRLHMLNFKNMEVIKCRFYDILLTAFGVTLWSRLKIGSIYASCYDVYAMFPVY